MKRIVLTGAVAAALFACAVGTVTGCGLVVGSGDYSVGDSGSSGDGGLVGESGTPVGEGGMMMMMSDGGTSDGSSTRSDAASAGLIGDPCTKNSDCKAAGTICSGTSCIVSCTTSATCGNNSAGTPNVCVQNVCAPGCTTSAGCAAYPGTTCQQLVAGAGMVCAGATTSGGGMIGDPCTTDSDCSVGTCMDGIPWCTTSCTAAGAACGKNSAGESNVCVENAANAFICFPGCTSNTNCTAFSGTTCQPVSTGGTQSICSAPADSFGFIGDPCTTSADCTDGSCESGILWCTMSCTVDDDCTGADSAGNPTYCVENGAGNMICFPGCTTNSDCAIYGDSALTCQAIGVEPGSICSTGP